jgi:hypothetical protein
MAAFGLVLACPVASTYLYLGLGWKPFFPFMLTAAPVFIVVALFLAFHIRAYDVVGSELHVRRFLGAEKIQLRDAISAELDSRVLRDAFHLQRLFSMQGSFRTKRLGLCRVRATDPGRAVVITFPAYKLIVTPDNPRALIAAMKRSRERLVLTPKFSGAIVALR